jgi:hypothetical protein
LKKRYSKLLVCKTMTLPYISDKGPRKRGPIAYARTKMESVNEETTSLVIPNSLSMALSAGATMEEETGEMKVKEDTTRVAAHFLPILQFLGLSGSYENPRVSKRSK